MTDNVTTVAYRSNLQPAGDILIQDERFHSKIHDPFALLMLQKQAYLTLIQKEELTNVALHCSYAEQGEYPYGTIADENGVQRVVCRCTNISCPLINKCNPDVDVEAVKLLQHKNMLEKPKVQRFYSEDDETTEVHVVEQLQVASSQSVPISHSTINDKPAVDFIIKAADIPIDSKHTPSVEAQKLTAFPDPFIIANQPSDIETKVEIHTPELKGFDRFQESTQQDIILSPINNRTIVNAGPGTGKTWTLIEKIIQMLTDNPEAAENILVLCFSKSAVDVIQKRLSKAAEQGRTPWTWRDIDIRTFDSFSTFMLSWVYENTPELLPKGFHLERLDYDARIKLATTVFLKNHDILADYEHIIVDEVQDLVGYRAELVIEMLKSLNPSCGFTLLGDSCQSLYDYVSVNNPDLVSSEEFYRLLFNNFPDVNYCALIENHRQNDELSHIMIPYRQAILTGSVDDRRAAACSMMSDVKSINLKFQHFQKEDALPYIQKGTLGILTRTNAQALQISSWLRTNSVPHLLQRAKGTPPLASWIYTVFCDYPNKTINEAAFIAQYLKKFPSSSYENAQKHWGALVDSQAGEPAAHYEVEDLLKGLIHNPKESLLFEVPGENEYAITVSTVHRAKGREFDSVLVLDDILEAKAETEEEELLEHKVCYVALTRPKKQIQSVHLPTQYIYTIKNEARRCFRAGGRPNRKYLSHFEVGQEKDILQTTSATDKSHQEYIQNVLKPGCRLRLLKCSETEFEQAGYVRYKLVPEDNDLMVLGYTSPDFAHEMQKAIQIIFNHSTSPINYKYFPRRFSDIYVERLTTQIAIIDNLLDGATSYGDVQIWGSFTVSGFAAMERDFY